MEQFFHKDVKPTETIDKIRSIFLKIGIFVTEQWYIFSEHCYSVRITISDLPHIGANGKGIDKEYALASAYAELVERIQNRVLFGPQYGMIEVSPSKYLDHENVPLCDLIEKDEFKIFQSLNPDTKNNICNNHSSIKCHPYYDVIKNTTKYIPDSLIFQRSGTTGFCAGNTPQEAISQGICEVFERFVAYKVFHEKIPLPIIPKTEVKSSILQKLIKSYEDNGFKLLIKDATLDGKYPVVAIVLCSSDRTKYKVTFGSDPYFETALSRCLTEIAQGKNHEDLISTFRDIPWIDSTGSTDQTDVAKQDIEFKRVFKNSSGAFPEAIFLNPKEKSIDNIFFQKLTDNNEILNKLTNIIIKEGYSLYIRDVSFLNFPSFRVIIPVMSNILNVGDKDIELNLERNSIKKALLKLKEASTDDLEKLADYIEYINHNTIVDDKSFFHSRTDAQLNKTKIGMKFSVNQLLFLIYSLLGDKNKIYQALDGFNIYNKGTDTPINKKLSKFLYRLKSALKFEKQGYEANIISNTIKVLYGDQIASRTMKFLSNPKIVLSDFRLPNCSDCKICPSANDCYFKEHKNYEELIFKQIKTNPIDQLYLKNYFK